MQAVHMLLRHLSLTTVITTRSPMDIMAMAIIITEEGMEDMATTTTTSHTILIMRTVVITETVSIIITGTHTAILTIQLITTTIIMGMEDIITIIITTRMAVDTASV